MMKPPARRAYISIPTAISASLPLGQEEHMWINDDTTWNLTERRHRLSSDVMPLSSLARGREREREKGGKKDVKKS